MTVQEFFDGLTSGATWSAGVAFKRSNPLPIDRYSVFNAYTPEGSAPDADDGSLNYYIEKNPVAYPGQVVAVIAEGSATVYVLQGETGGTLKPVALASSETTADIAELESKVSALETWKGQVETWQNTVLVDGDVETSLSGSSGKIPDSAAVKTVTDGLSSEIDALEGTVSGLGSTYEALANKTQSIATDTGNTTKYPSVKAVEDAIAAAKSDVLTDADVDSTFAGTSGKVPDSAAVKAVTDGLDTRIDSLEGAADTYVLKADVDTASLSNSDAKVPSSKLVKTTTDALDTRIESLETAATGYEVTSNKVTAFSSPTDTQYPSAKLVYDQLATKLGDATSDGKIYGRQDGNWVEVDVADPDLSAVLAAGNQVLSNTHASIHLENASGAASAIIGVTSNIPSVGLIASGKDAELSTSDLDFTDAAGYVHTVYGLTGLKINDSTDATTYFNIEVPNAASPTPVVSGTDAMKSAFKTWLEVNNVTNESKATMFTNPTFTGTVTVPVTPANNTDAASKKYVDDSIVAATPTLAQVVAKGNVITGTADTDKTTLSAGVVSLENATNNFKVDVVSASVTGSEGMKDAFINWLGVGQVYRYETA